MSFLFGLVLKIYDDMIDNKLLINKHVTDFFCYMTISLATLSCYLSGSFTLIYLEMTLLTFAMDNLYTYQFKQDTEESKDFQGMNDSIWTYTCILSAVFAIYHFTKNNVGFRMDSVKKRTLSILAVVNFFIITLDIYFTPEHSSQKKFNARLVMFFIMLATVVAMIKHNGKFYDGTIGIMLMNLGFLTGSLIYMSLENTSAITNLKPRIKKKKSKHKKVINRKKL